MSTSTRTLTIGELSARIASNDLSAYTVDIAVAAEFDVEVEYSYEPGHAGCLTGPMDMAEEPIPASVEVHSIKASAAVHFEGDHCEVIFKRGTELIELFKSREIGALEDRIMDAIENDKNDY